MITSQPIYAKIKLIMIIKNIEQLSRTPLRKATLLIAAAGVKAVLPKNVIFENISVKNNLLLIKNRKFDLRKYRRLFIFAFGKAAADSAQSLEKILGNYLTSGVVIDTKTYKSKRLKVFAADHPLPTKRNIKAGRELIKTLKSLGKFTKNDMVLTIISGGASVLLCYPHQLTTTKLGAVVSALLKRGADIKEINIVRKHLSLIHGGYFAKYVYPAKTIALLYSDVPTSDLSVIASGPTFRDNTTVNDAKRIAKKYSLGKQPFIETPKDKKYFKNVSNILVCDNLTALKAMRTKAKELGYKPIIYSNQLHGEARHAGKKLLAKLKAGTAVLAAGETTVKVKGFGKGGRNQELVLGSLPRLKEKEVIISIASDGKDFIKGAGGAIADLNTLKKAAKMNLDYKKYLNNNDAYNFFKKTGDLILTNPTGANVSDLIIALKEK
jgi:glycerate 2-kinase